MLLLHVVFVILLVGTATLFTGISVLNIQHGEQKLTAHGDWVVDTFPIEEPQRLLDYSRARSGLSEIRAWIGLGVLFLVLYGGIFADAVELVEATGWPFLLRGTVFLVGLVLLGSIVSVPFDLFSTFVIEELFDFNEQTVFLWIRDTVVSLLISTILTSVLVVGVLVVLEWFPLWWWVAAWALILAFQLLLYVLYPRVIAPLFYDFQPIESGELHDAVEEVFDSAGFSMSGIYVIDASRRTTKSNAFFAGFGRAKRVALFDTLTENLELPEIQSVLAHELAHWKYAHVWKRLAASGLRMGAILFIVSVLLRTEWLYTMFEVPTSASYAGLVLAGLWIGPVNQLLTPLDNRLSIAHEYEADAFAASIVQNETIVQEALQKIAGKNLSNPFPHPVYEAFHYDHPPIVKRLQALGDGTETPDLNEDTGEAEETSSEESGDV